MKTSNTLLMGLLAIVVLTLAVSAVSLKSEYDKIDFGDPFYGFSSTTVKPFRVLKIEGFNPALAKSGQSSGNHSPDHYDSYTSIGVQAGKTFEIRVQKDSEIAFTYRLAGDTLIVRYEPAFHPRRISADEAFANMPFAYVIAPAVQTVLANGSTCKLAGFTLDTLAIVATDARVMISQSRIGRLQTTGRCGSLLLATSTNRIDTAVITSHDSTGFIAERDVFGSIRLQNDSSATVKVPAALLKRIVF